MKDWIKTFTQILACVGAMYSSRGEFHFGVMYLPPPPTTDGTDNA